MEFNKTTQVYIAAIDKKTGEYKLITDLYWFAENLVHDWKGDGADAQYDFQIAIVESEDDLTVIARTQDERN